MTHIPARIVLTGGPGAGKTLISRHLAATHPDRFVCVPEAATQVYSALGTRWDRLTVAERRDVQRRIYQLQVEQETRVETEANGKVLLLDRGTVDGSAYWPERPADYWRALGTSAGAEVGRYGAVLWLQTCAAIGRYDDSFVEGPRHESAGAAISNGRRVWAAWAGHPNLHRVEACADFEQKISAVEALLLRLTGGQVSRPLSQGPLKRTLRKR